MFYIDYGETENVKDNRICIELLEEFLSFPSQALRCCLAGIRPVSIIRGIHIALTGFLYEIGPVNFCRFCSTGGIIC